MILSAHFDPISQREIDYIKALKKEKGIRKIGLYVLKDGILNRAKRIDLVKKAIRAYGYIELVNTDKDAILLEEFDEESIRHGEYKLCAKGIQKELIQEGYYFEEMIRYYESEKRYLHSKSVAETARKLALHYHVDEQKAYQMGILHDITKEFSKEENLKLLGHDLQKLAYSEKVWHSYTGAIWLKEHLGIQDEVLLNAIARHTLGEAITIYDHILYVADKIEPLRAYNTEIETALAYQDIKAATKLIREETMKLLERDGENV